MRKPLLYPEFRHEIPGLDRKVVAKAVGAQIREYLRYKGSNAESNRLLQEFFARVLTPQEMAATKNEQPRSDGQPRSFFNLNKRLISGVVGSDTSRTSDVAERAYYWFHFGKPPEDREDLLPDQRAHGVAIDRKLFGRSKFGEDIDEAVHIDTNDQTHPSSGLAVPLRQTSGSTAVQTTERVERLIDPWRHFLDTRGVRHRNRIVPIARAVGPRGLIEYRKASGERDNDIISADVEFRIWLGHRLDGRLIGLQEEGGQWWPIRLRDHYWHWDIDGDVTVPELDASSDVWFQMAEPDAGTTSYPLTFVFVVGPLPMMDILLADFSEEQPMRRDALEAFAAAVRDIDLDVHIRLVIVQRSTNDN